MQQSQAGTAHSVPMAELTTHPWIYLGLALAMSVTAYWGFAYTYFIPVLAGVYPQVSLAIHVHGWSFFLRLLLARNARVGEAGGVLSARCVHCHRHGPRSGHQGLRPPRVPRWPADLPRRSILIPVQEALS